MNTALTTVGRHCHGGAGIHTILKMKVLNGDFAIRAFTAPAVRDMPGVFCSSALSGILTALSDPAKGSGADLPPRITALSGTHRREARHHG